MEVWCVVAERKIGVEVRMPGRAGRGHFSLARHFKTSLRLNALTDYLFGAGEVILYI